MTPKLNSRSSELGNNSPKSISIVLTIAFSRIPPSQEVKNLGAWFDDTLSMSTHVTKVAASRFYSLYKIHRFRKYLSRQSCETLVNALVTFRLDYCNSLLLKTKIRKFFLQLKTKIKKFLLIINCYVCVHIFPLFQSLDEIMKL